MKDKIGVIVWGLGAMGSGIAKIILEKEGLVLVGVIENAPTKVGRRLYDILGLESSAKGSCIVSEDDRYVLGTVRADVAVIATGSFLKEVFPQVRASVKAGLNVVTTAEELTQPYVAEKTLAEEIDRLARANGVTVLGTGINPGFVMDFLPIILTGVCQRVSRRRVTRTNDLSAFGEVVMREQGVGMTSEQFWNGVRDGTVTGHVGFAQSFAMFEQALNLRFSRTEQTREPIISRVPRATATVLVLPGQVAGCRHIGRAYVGETLFLQLEHPQQVRPEAEGIVTADSIEIEGVPTIRLQGSPEIAGGIGTIGICVNMIPHVLNASPGLTTMLDLPVPRGLLAEVG